MLILFLIIILPAMEIAGFVIIGGEIGLGYSLLWVLMTIMAGFHFLTTMGTTTLKKAKQSVDDDVYPLEEMFDGVCVLIGSLLLIIPGFISDFISVLFLVPFIRKGIFLLLKSQHESVLDGFTKSGEGVSGWYYEKTSSSSGEEVIEGEYTVVEKREELPKL
ncbi:MAG: FxsA family protein [Proteobacteria bacterium]|nr:FxsA family protein [Pseudomonadota bacterium]